MRRSHSLSFSHTYTCTSAFLLPVYLKIGGGGFTEGQRPLIIRFQVMVWNVPDRKAIPWKRVVVAGLNLQLEQRDAAAQEGRRRRRQSAASISVSIIKRSARLEPILIKCLH